MKPSEIIDLVPDVAGNLPTNLPTERGGPRLEARRKKPRQERLTKRQMAFVEALIANGGDRADAAKAAGCSDASASVTAWKWLRHPLVAEEIVRRTQELVAATAPAAVMKLRDLMENARSQFVQLEAAKDLADRAGVGKSSKAPTAPLVVNIRLE